MDNVLKLAKKYSKNDHGELLPKIGLSIPEALTYLYDIKWETDKSKIPYEILTYLLDCYYCLPERPDLASLFAWQAINHSYNEFLLDDHTKKSLQDTAGIMQLKNKILNQYVKYKPFLHPYFSKLPIKIFHYVAAFMLKGYVLEKNGFERKFRASSYDSLNSKVPIIKELLENAYGKALYDISEPTVQNDKVFINADAVKSRKITHSFALKLQELIVKRTTIVTFKDETLTQKTYVFSDDDELMFIIFGVLYASRCNNFHGNSASRLNSINADKETFKMYTDIFLIEYMLLAITLNISGKLSDAVLIQMKENEKLIIF